MSTYRIKLSNGVVVGSLPVGLIQERLASGEYDHRTEFQEEESNQWKSITTLFEATQGNRGIKHQGYATQAEIIADVANQASSPRSGVADAISTPSLSAFVSARSKSVFAGADVGSINKVMRVSLKGGLLGLLADDPHKTLSAAIARENREGWKVIQIIPDDTGNLVIMIIRFVVLMLTFLLYMPANGYWVVMERVSLAQK